MAQQGPIGPARPKQERKLIEAGRKSKLSHVLLRADMSSSFYMHT